MIGSPRRPAAVDGEVVPRDVGRGVAEEEGDRPRDLIGGADAMVIKPMAYVSLTIDHRVLDGHQTNAWLTRFVEVLETWPLED